MVLAEASTDGAVTAFHKNWSPDHPPIRRRHSLRTHTEVIVEIKVWIIVNRGEIGSREVHDVASEMWRQSVVLSRNLHPQEFANENPRARLEAETILCVNGGPILFRDFLTTKCNPIYIFCTFLTTHRKSKSSSSSPSASEMSEQSNPSSSSESERLWFWRFVIEEEERANENWVT